MKTMPPKKKNKKNESSVRKSKPLYGTALLKLTTSVSEVTSISDVPEEEEVDKRVATSAVPKDVRFKEKKTYFCKQYNNRKRIDNHAKIVLKEEKLYLKDAEETTDRTSCGEYYLIDHFPLGTLHALLFAFMCPERRKKFYERKLTKIRGCNPGVVPPAKYTEGIDISSPSSLQKLGQAERYALSALIQSFKHNCEQLASIDYQYFSFGLIVQNSAATHQKLHCDYDPNGTIVNTASDDCLILHLPLSNEGLWLHLARRVETGCEDSDVKINSNIIHVPFGQAILLKVNQYHGGHYGNIGNTRLHFVMSTNPVESDVLYRLDDDDNCYLIPPPHPKRVNGAACRSNGILNRFRRMYTGPCYQAMFDFCENRNNSFPDSEMKQRNKKPNDDTAFLDEQFELERDQKKRASVAKRTTETNFSKNVVTARTTRSKKQCNKKPNDERATVAVAEMRKEKVDEGKELSEWQNMWKIIPDKQFELERPQKKRATVAKKTSKTKFSKNVVTARTTRSKKVNNKP